MSTTPDCPTTSCPRCRAPALYWAETAGGGVKDTQGVYYKLCGVSKDLVQTELAKCETSKEAMDMAGDFT